MDYRYIYSSQQKWSRSDKLFLDKAIAFLSNYAGTDYLKDVCLFISQSLQVSYSTISTIAEKDSVVATTVVWMHGTDLLENISYLLEGTPCMNTVEYGICYYPANVTSIFPDDTTLQELHINSYMGTVLNGAAGERIGLISLLHEGTFNDPALAEAFLTILCPSIEEELKSIIH